MSEKNVFEEYGPQRSLQDILEELNCYIQMKCGTEKADFEIILPTKVIEAYTAEWEAKVKYQDEKKNKEARVEKVHWIASGVVTIHDASKKKVVDK